MSTTTISAQQLNHAVMQHSAMVIRIAFQRTQNLADAEDMAQDVFIKLMQQSPFHSEEYLKAWLIRVTVNSCKNLKKSYWHRNTTALTGTEPFTPHQQSLLEELWRLPPKYRDVIYLHYYEGYTIDEMAQLLLRKPNTVGSWLTRAKKQLKTILEEGDLSYV